MNVTDAEESATLILKGLGCENLDEEVLELDVLSHFLPGAR